MGLQLDTIEIYQMVSSNRDLRAQLVARVKPVIDQGEAILKSSPTVMKAALLQAGVPAEPGGNNPGQNSLPLTITVAATDSPETVRVKLAAVYASQLQNLDQKLQSAAASTNGAAESLKNGYTKWLAGISDPVLKNALTNSNLLAQPGLGKTNLQQRVASIVSETRDQVLEQFDQATLREAQASIKVSSQEWNDLRSSIDSTGFELFPRQGLRWAKKDEQGRLAGPVTWSQVWGMFWHHALGLLFSVLLLSLGAPFWFNALKELANLRSSVANNIAAEEKATAAGKKRRPVDTLPVSVG